MVGEKRFNMFKKGFLTGLLLFGMFFGAGNLIFPVSMGAMAGRNVVPATLGFIFTGVGLAVVTLILGAFCEGGYIKELSDKFGKCVAVILLLVLYFTIGPFFAIPRTAATSYEIGIKPLVSNFEFLSKNGLLIYSIIYFVFALLISLNTSKIMDRIGKVLTPIFAIMILILVIAGSIKYSANVNVADFKEYADSVAFGTGFQNGYNTMDAIASIVFSGIAIITLQQFGFKNKTEYSLILIIVGVITALGFSILYVGLSYLGNKFPIDAAILNDVSIDKGSYIITNATRDIFGNVAGVFLSIMVVLTCFTTGAGLIVSISHFLYELFNKIPYVVYVISISALSAVITNFGLQTIISYAIPVLCILYPLIISIVLIIILNKFIPLSYTGMKLCIGLVILYALIDQFVPGLTSFVPFDNYSIGWIWFFIVGILFSFILKDKNNIVR